MTIPPFDVDTAKRTLRVLQHAHDRWQHQATQFKGTRFTDADHRETIGLELHGTAIEVLMWVRSLDDCCKSKPGYSASRAALEDLLDGARYAVNGAVHQLSAVTQAYGVMAFPLEFGTGAGIFNTFGGARWAAEGYLPAREDERDNTQRRLRDCYLQHLAGQEISTTLASLRRWFEHQLAA